MVIAVSIAYPGILFAVAFYGDRRADTGRSLINNGTTYALSLGVFATSWTYYGSVGGAASGGYAFLTTYLGPTLMFALGWLVLRRIIRISRRDHITSLADFISARYGKSSTLGGLVTVIAVIGIVPYISLQLKAVSTTFEIIRRHPAITSASRLEDMPLYADTALYVALLLAGFTILFGTRHLDATERHEGMVAAIAFDSVVKFVAFVAAGLPTVSAGHQCLRTGHRGRWPPAAGKHGRRRHLCAYRADGRGPGSVDTSGVPRRAQRGDRNDRVVEMVALATMVSNSLVMPALLRGAPKFVRRRNLGRLILGVRRATIVL